MPERRAPIRQTLRGCRYPLGVGLLVAVGLALTGGGGVIFTYLSGVVAVVGLFVAVMAWLIQPSLQPVRQVGAEASWATWCAAVAALQLLSVPLGRAVDLVEVARGKAWCERASEAYAAASDDAERSQARRGQPRIVEFISESDECWVYDRSSLSAWWVYHTSMKGWTYTEI